MWDLSSQVHWWEEWQLRILVLSSLFLQFILFFGSMMRQVRALKSCFWLAYIGADAMAIYGLSTLFNRHNPVPAGGGGRGHATSSSPLEILWAPVLLLHLGGHHTFTAYSMEDNELWGRQLVTLASQVTVALYVFCKSWSSSGGDKKLLQASVLLFVAGILKSILRPCALKAASFNSQLMSSSSVYPQRRAPKPKFFTMLIKICLTGFYKDAPDSIHEAVSLRDEEDHDLSLDEYVQKARDLALVTEVDPKNSAKEDVYRVNHFVDLSTPYSHRLRHLSSFLKLGVLDVIRLLVFKLHFSFMTIYTDFRAAQFGLSGFLVRLLLPFITLSSAVLFGQSHKHGYQDKDVKVTYVLLWCTTLVSFLTLLLAPWYCRAMIWPTTSVQPQHNIISCSARRRKPTMLMKFCAVTGSSDYINRHWYITYEAATAGVINLVLNHAKDGWTQYIVDGASYRRFNNLRGQWAISRHKVRDPRLLLWSFKVPFDHSVLVWHVATELCLHHPKQTSPLMRRSAVASQYSKVISDYMIYLLLIRPEMLMPGTRQALFTNTSDDIEIMLKHVEDGAPLMDERSVAQQILRVAQSPSLDARLMGPWILKACKLAEDLMDLLGDNERWLLIRDVWVEMLCYSAGRCRGYLHAKAMAEGIELLTYVWLLLSRIGMETFADKFQRPEPTTAHGQENEPKSDGGGTASQPQGRNIEEGVDVDGVDSASEPQDGPVQEITIAVE